MTRDRTVAASRGTLARGGPERGPWTVGALLRASWRALKVSAVIGRAGVGLLLRRPKTRREGALWVQRTCRGVIRTLGIPVTVEGAMPEQGALVLNHQGYLDILVVASLRPCVFVSKAEVATWPAIGWMIAAAGTVFVKRGEGGSGAAASVEMREAAAEGLPIVFFPEGTTSSGEGLLPFHGGLLAEARAAELPVVAGVIRYTVAGPVWARVTRDVAYWGEDRMLPHMARLLSLRGIAARVRFATGPIHFAGEDRKLAAAEAREAMLGLEPGAFASDEAATSA